MYTESKIQAASKLAKFHGYSSGLSREQAISFLDWYFSNDANYETIQEAAQSSLLGNVPNGYRQQEQFLLAMLGDPD